MPLEGIPELHEGDDLGQKLYEAARRIGGLETGDVSMRRSAEADGRVEELAAETEPQSRACHPERSEGAGLIVRNIPFE